MLYGTSDSEPQTDYIIAQLSQELYNSNLLLLLIQVSWAYDARDAGMTLIETQHWCSGCGFSNCGTAHKWVAENCDFLDGRNFNILFKEAQCH